jgi:hypothetical protein
MQHSIRFGLHTPMGRQRGPAETLSLQPADTQCLSFSTASIATPGPRPSRSTAQLVLPNTIAAARAPLRSVKSDLSLAGRRLSVPRSAASGEDAGAPKAQRPGQRNEDPELAEMKREMQGTLLEIAEDLLQDVEKRQPYTPLPAPDPRVDRCMESERQALKLGLAKRMMHDMIRSRGRPLSQKVQAEMIEQANRFCELRRQATIHDLGYKGEYKGWRSATQHQAHRGRGHSPQASAAAAAAEPEWEDDPLPTHRSADSALETPGSTDSRARARRPRRAKQPHNALPTIQPPRGPYKVRDSLSIIATDELPPGPFVDKREIEMYRHVTQR